MKQRSTFFTQDRKRMFRKPIKYGNIIQ